MTGIGWEGVRVIRVTISAGFVLGRMITNVHAAILHTLWTVSTSMAIHVLLIALENNGGTPLIPQTLSALLAMENAPYATDLYTRTVRNASQIISLILKEMATLARLIVLVHNGEMQQPPMSPFAAPAMSHV